MLALAQRPVPRARPARRWWRHRLPSFHYASTGGRVTLDRCARDAARGGWVKVWSAATLHTAPPAIRGFYFGEGCFQRGGLLAGASLTSIAARVASIATARPLAALGGAGAAVEAGEIAGSGSGAGAIGRRVIFRELVEADHGAR